MKDYPGGNEASNDGKHARKEISSFHDTRNSIEILSVTDNKWLFGGEWKIYVFNFFFSYAIFMNSSHGKGIIIQM